MKRRSIPTEPAFIFLFLILVCQVFLSFPQAHSNPEKVRVLGYKNFISKTISPDRIDRFLKYFTAEPHVASSPRNNELAVFILEEWKTYGLDEVRLAQYDVLLSFPKKIIVEMFYPKKYRLALKEAGYEKDSDTLRPDVGLPYNAYSCSGDITASLVYANSGNPQDYDLLEKKGINLKGKISLVRYSSQ